VAAAATPRILFGAHFKVMCVLLQFLRNVASPLALKTNPIASIKYHNNSLAGKVHSIAACTEKSSFSTLKTSQNIAA
jgi:hypothetical protein